MATLGAAVGLGNLWKFPYMIGQNGGGAFLILFILFTLILGLPLMLSEFIIGGVGKGNSYSAIKKLAPQSSWRFIGFVGNINLLLIMSFYSIIAGWSLIYLGHATLNHFDALAAESSHTLFVQMMSSPILMLIGHTLFCVLTSWIIYRGVQKGLERASKIMMPALFLLLLLIIIVNLFQGGFAQAATFLFTPDFSKITGKVFLDALGQACFSLAAGAGALCIYASYLKDNSGLTRQSLIIVTANIIIAILAGLAIFPIVFRHGLSPAAGTSLIFETLPLALGALPFGNILGIALFVLFLFAALTSSISLIESPVAFLEKELSLSRRRSTVMVTSIPWVLGVIYILLWNHPLGVFDKVIHLATNILLPLTGASLVFFVGWKIGQTKIANFLQLRSRLLIKLLTYGLKVIVPLTLILISIMNQF